MDLDGDTLRRKHIQTLEVLQRLSDENECLKRQLQQSSAPASQGGQSLDSSSNDTSSSHQLLVEKQNEIRALESTITTLKSDLKTSASDLKTYKSKYSEERSSSSAQASRMKKDMETQALLMQDLRSQLDALQAGQSSAALSPAVPSPPCGPDPNLALLEEQVKAQASLLAQLEAERLSSAESSVLAASRISQLDSDLQIALASLASSPSSSDVDCLTAENSRLSSENARLKASSSATESENRRLSSLSNAARLELSALSRQVQDQALALPQSLSSSLSADPPSQTPAVLVLAAAAPAFQGVDGASDDFGRFVSLKKENAALKMQINSLQQTLQMHAGKRGKQTAAIMFSNSAR